MRSKKELRKIAKEINVKENPNTLTDVIKKYNLIDKEVNLVIRLLISRQNKTHNSISFNQTARDEKNDKCEGQSVEPRKTSSWIEVYGRTIRIS